jgi:hypothetical protein
MYKSKNITDHNWALYLEFLVSNCAEKSSKTSGCWVREDECITPGIK